MVSRGKTTYQLLQHVLGTRHQRQLAVFLHYKHLYENSCYFKWNFSKIARLAGDSRKKARKYVKAFLGRGWCREHCGNLIFKNIHEVSEIETGKRGFLFEVKGDNSKDIYDDLFEVALYLRIDQCHKRRLDATSPDPDERKRRFKGEMGGGYQSISYAGLRRIWGVHSPGHIVKRLLNKGRLSVKRQKPEIVRGYNGEQLQYPYFSFKGKVWKGMPSKYHVDRHQCYKQSFIEGYRYITVPERFMRKAIELGTFYKHQVINTLYYKDSVSLFGPLSTPHTCF